VSVQGTDYAQGCTIAELEAILARRRESQQQTHQDLKSKGWGTLVLPRGPRADSTHLQDSTPTEGETATQPQLQTAGEGAGDTTVTEDAQLTCIPQHAPVGVVDSTIAVPGEGNLGPAHDPLVETEEEMKERKRKRREAKKIRNGTNQTGEKTDKKQKRSPAAAIPAPTLDEGCIYLPSIDTEHTIHTLRHTRVDMVGDTHPAAPLLQIEDVQTLDSVDAQIFDTPEVDTASDTIKRVLIYKRERLAEKQRVKHIREANIARKSLTGVH
jgi:hypothetical protein